MVRFGVISHWASRRQRDPGNVGDLGIARNARTAGVFRPGALHAYPVRDFRITWLERFRVAGVDQERPVTSESGQHNVQNVARHAVKVAGALDGAVDPVEAFEGHPGTRVPEPWRA